MKKNFIILSAGLIGLLSACKSPKETAKQEVKNEGNPSSLSSIDMSYMDMNIKPQDDFFLFSNGSWVKNNPVPSNESRWGSFNELQKSNNEKLTQLLKKSTKEEGTIKNVIGNYYESFMNMETRNQLGIAPIQADLNKINGLRNKESISEVIAMLHAEGVGALFGFGVDQDLMNVNINRAYWGQGGIGLPNRDYYFDENKKDILTAYQAHIVAILKLAKHDETVASKKAQHVIEFEKELASAMMTPAEQRVPEKSYNVFLLNQAYKTLKDFDFENYLIAMKMRAFDTLIVAQPKYMEKVNEMMKGQSMEKWRDYLEWCLLNEYAGHLSEPFVKQNFAFYGTKLKGVSEMKSNDDQVIEEITNMEIGELLGKYFVESHYSEKASARINEMVDNLLFVFKSRIESSDWMSVPTKREALNKLNSIGRKLGHPEKYKNFDPITLNAGTYVANIKKLNRFATENNLEEIYKSVDKAKWGMPAHMVNAYYHPLLNEIAFPAGIMQPPFFDENAEDAVNYGRIGMVIGHEFTHGFDDMGSKFAADGSFRNWWTDEDRKKFEARTEILGETFGVFCPIEGHCVNPELTMGENIADLGGLTMAYYAYTLTDEFKSGQKVKGYTPAQRFFISYAQLWKINYTEAELKNRIANDSHSPGMYRVNGPLMNCPEFFEAFQVKEGDKMRNKEIKVARIW